MPLGQRSLRTPDALYRFLARADGWGSAGGAECAGRRDVVAEPSGAMALAQRNLAIV